MTNERHHRFHDESNGLQALHMQGLQVTQPERGLSDVALQLAWRVRGADVCVRRIQGESAISLLSIAIHQVQLRPQYHPSYSVEQTLSAGRPISPLHQSRKDKLHAICLELGESMHVTILEVMRKTDSKIHKDDCRKMLDELCAEKRMDKRVVISGGKKVFYTARPE